MPTATSATRSSGCVALSRTFVRLLATVVLGLGSRASWVPQLLRLYAGDVMWAVLFFQLFHLLLRRRSVLYLWTLTLLTTELIECSQLWHTPWFDQLRDTRIGGLLLGHGFLWSDVVCLVVGASAAASALHFKRRRMLGANPENRAAPLLGAP